MKNIAIFNTCISGSTGKIAVGLFSKLKNEGYNPYFYYGREDGKTEVNYNRMGNKLNMYFHAALAKFCGLQGFGSVFPTIRTIKDLKNKEIDTIFIVSPHGYYLNEKRLWKFIIENSIRTIYLMIDEYAFLGSCGYSNGCTNYLTGCYNCPQMKKVPLAQLLNGPSATYNVKKRMYQKCEELIFVGPEYTVLQAKASPLMKKQRCIVLDEAINTDFYTPRNTSRIREKLRIDDKKIIAVCVAPYSYERKGCRYFVELARRFEDDDHYVFVQVGFNIDAKKVDLPSNYIPIGFLQDQNELAEYYSLGDIFVFPSLLDTMPNACLEALSAGTPLMLFNISGMPYIADNSVATFIAPKDVDQMEVELKKVKKKDEKIIATCRNYALKRYDSKKYYSQLMQIAIEGISDDTF